MDITLTLSGGGVRASVFHLGVLRRLAEEGLFDAITTISTVSAGSLVTAALIVKAGLSWPSSTDYITRVYPEIRRLLTTTDLFTLRAVGLSGLLRYNVSLLRHRAQVLAELLEARWGVRGGLAELPDRPVWWINTTCVETGKNWRFSKREMGDWQFGRHYSPPFRIADAAAASASVPYAIGALTILLPGEGWYRTDPATRRPLDKQRPPAARVHLWDGGAYENLGLEAVFKSRQTSSGPSFLICNDASAPLQLAGSMRTGGRTSMLKGGLTSPRLFDICSDQTRSLRSRMFVGALETGRIRGVLLRMGNSVRDIDVKAGRERSPEEYDRFLRDREVALAFQHSTDLRAVPEPDFDRIARHGYEIADATLTTYAPEIFHRSICWT